MEYPPVKRRISFFKKEMIPINAPYVTIKRLVTLITAANKSKK